jgi:hypothetical protein
MADHDYNEAAELLPVSVWWLQKNIRRLPHLRFGNKVFFTDEHLEEIRRLHERRPEQAAS